MKKRLFSWLIVLTLASLLMAACAAPATPTEAPAEEPMEEATEEPVAEATEEPVAEATEEPMEEETEEPMVEMEPIKVGVVTDLSGALAVYGVMIQRSFLLGMEYEAGAAGTDDVFTIDGHPVEILFRDDQSTPETTATVARELIEVDDVDVLVGTVSSGATATLQELAAENEIPLIVAPAAANEITGASFNPYTFRTSRNNYQDAVNLCQYLATQYSTFVQIAPDYSFGYGGAEAFRDACTFYGGEFVADDVFAPADTTEFTPYMEQILNSGAEAWVVTWAGGGFVSMMQAASDLGVLDEMALGASIANNAIVPVFYSTMVGQNSGILYHYTLPDNEINDWLVEQVQDRYGEPPDLFDADGMNAAILLVEALRATEWDTSTDALIGAMEGMTFDGPKGEIYIRPEDHVAIQDMYIVNILNIDDPDYRFFELVETTRPDVPCQLPEEYVDRCGDLSVGSLSGE